MLMHIVDCATIIFICSNAYVATTCSDGKSRDTVSSRDSIFTVLFLVLVLRITALVLVSVSNVVSWSRVSSRHLSRQL